MEKCKYLWVSNEKPKQIFLIFLYTLPLSFPISDWNQPLISCTNIFHSISPSTSMPLIPKLRSSHHILVLFLAVWCVAFIYFEHVVPRSTANRCSWTGMVPTTSYINTNIRATAANKKSLRTADRRLGTQTNVLLVADPQLIDNHTYPGRNNLLLKLSKHTVDVYLKQNYKALVNSLHPDYIIFLGDYLDNGRLLQDAYYEKEFARFESIFNRWPKKYVRGLNFFTNLPGNHDVGFGDGVKPLLQKRFLNHFGQPNVIHSINGVEFVLLDTPSLLSGNSDISADSSRFLLLIPPPKVPRVLLSHVPLRRDVEKHPCGPLRESKNFYQNAGYQYQLALSQEVTDELLQKVQPSLIFSGDDHDYCDVVHPGNAREVTVKSISMAMGIKYPAVQLLSYSFVPQFQYETHICYLPVPYVDVYVYVLMAVANGLILLAWSIKQRSSRYNYSILPSWDENTSAILMDSPPAMSQKVSNFLKEQDDAAHSTSHSAPVVSLSNYTFTSVSSSDKAWKEINRAKRIVRRFSKKWNLATFFKHSAVLAGLVITLYNIIVWTV